MSVHEAQRLCDGRTWYDGGWLRIDGGRVVEWGAGRYAGDEPVRRHACLIPGLVDMYARVTGFVDRVIRNDALAPHQACVALMAEAGVTVALDVGGHPEVPATIAALAGPGRLRLSWTGPVLDAPPVRIEATRLVGDPASARHAVDLLAAEGASWAHTGPSLPPETVAAVVEAARTQGMKVLHHPGATTAAAAARAGVHLVAHLPLVLDRPARVAGPADLIRSYADRSAGHVDTLAVLAGEGVGVVPLLHSWRRGSVLEDAVGEPRLERLLDVAPFHRYLLDMRGPGLAFGRRYAKSHLGYEHLKGKLRDEFERGWSALLDSLAYAHGLGVPVLPGSEAIGISLVPGFAVHDELAVWQRAGIPWHAALTSATGSAAGLLFGAGTPPWHTGVLALSTDPAGSAGMAAVLADATVLLPAPVDGRARFVEEATV